MNIDVLNHFIVHSINSMLFYSVREACSKVFFRFVFILFGVTRKSNFKSSLVFLCIENAFPYICQCKGKISSALKKVELTTSSITLYNRATLSKGKCCHQHLKCSRCTRNFCNYFFLQLFQEASFRTTYSCIQFVKQTQLLLLQENESKTT